MENERRRWGGRIREKNEKFVIVGKKVSDLEKWKKEINKEWMNERKTGTKLKRNKRRKKDTKKERKKE